MLRRLAVAALACMLAACQTPPAPAPKGDRIVLLPQADGSTSGVSVRPTAGGNEALLSQPYAAASVTTQGVATSTSSAAEVRTRYPALYDAMPVARKSYVLYFETGGDRLTTDSNERLNDIMAEVAKLPAPELLVVGHTDTQGIDSSNDDLSMQRARLVRTRLIERGIAQARIEAVGRGKRDLLVPTRDGVAEPRNRRVEIQVR